MLCEKDLTCLSWLWMWGKRPWTKQCGWSLEAGKGKDRFSPRASRKKHSPANTLILAQWDLGQASDLQNCEKENCAVLFFYNDFYFFHYFLLLCCFRSWSFAVSKYVVKTTKISNIFFYFGSSFLSMLFNLCQEVEHFSRSLSLSFSYGHTCSIWKLPGCGSNQSCSCQPTPQPQQHWIQAASVTYTGVHGSARFLIHWARLRINLESSWILVRFLNCWTTTLLWGSWTFLSNSLSSSNL